MKDRRYNHTYGRSAAAFESSEGGPVSIAEREVSFPLIFPVTLSYTPRCLCASRLVYI